MPWKKGAVGIVVRDVEANEVVDLVHRNLDGKSSNNIAEYLGVIRSCEYAIHHGYTRVRIVTDSQLVFRQLSGEYEVRKKELKVLHRTAMKLFKQVRAVLAWHRREEGDGPLADQLASWKWKEVIDGYNSNTREGRVGKDVGGSFEEARTAPINEGGEPNNLDNAKRISCCNPD
jgi:ribonuclease HI